jgi:tocopherol cyclase
MPSVFWTPHSGYHWQGSARRFFEGWYVRLTLPDPGETWAFMYSIDDPAGQSALSGGAAQILGPNETYQCTPLPNLEGFWAWKHGLGVGHWGATVAATCAPRYLTSPEFTATVQQGYQLTATHHQGQFIDADTGTRARWDYAITPIYGWGPRDRPALPTAGWLSYLPIFEPGWQVLMAHGLATGWAEWGDRRYDFQQAPTYMEKNWGGAFPQRWFWIQANAFEATADLTITAVGGLRQVFGRLETVGLIGLHVRQHCIVLTSLRDRLTWQVETWGHWHVEGRNHRYRVVLTGQTDRPPAEVRVPTLEGLQFQCWDTTHGHLDIQVWERSQTAPFTESLILHDRTSLAALEVGGHGWEHPWQWSP